MRSISTNISALGQRTQLKFGELSSLFIVYNITIFLLCPLHSFYFIFYCVTAAHTLYISLLDPKRKRTFHVTSVTQHAAVPGNRTLVEVWEGNRARTLEPWKASVFFEESAMNLLLQFR